MVAKRIRVPCPSCSHRLHIRAEDLGKKGECKYCGHRFRPRVKPGPGGSPGTAMSRVPAQENRTADLGQWVERLEHDLEKSWARLTAKQASLVEQLMVTLGSRFSQSQLAAAVRESAPSQQSLNGPPDHRPHPSDWVEGLEPPDEELADDLIDSEQLELQFESAEQPVASECARLRHELDHLREALAERQVEVAGLRKSADRLKYVRAERDRLNAERSHMARQATELQARLVEIQVALVEVEAELDDCRERARIERQEWEQQRQELTAEADRRLAEQQSRHEAEHAAAQRSYQAQIELLSLALDEVELGQCAPIAGS